MEHSMGYGVRRDESSGETGSKVRGLKSEIRWQIADWRF